MAAASIRESISRNRFRTFRNHRNENHKSSSDLICGISKLYLVIYLSLFAVILRVEAQSTTTPTTTTTTTAATSAPIYAIVAPAKIRPNSDYHVTIHVTNASKPVDFELELSGPSANEQGFMRTTNAVRVDANETRMLDLPIGAWSAGNYKLIVTARSGDDLQIRNETAIGFEPKSNSIFVQTDKAIYKPGQAVRFRAIIVDSSLLPFNGGLLDIYIKDSKQNLIKQWKRIATMHGVVSEQLQLSEQPPLGDWSIMVDVGGQKYTKTFTVAEYVLPTFSVDVQLPPYATYNRSDVVATVSAMYTYGKPVKGEVTLTVQPRIRHSSISFRPLEQYQTKMRIGADTGKVDIPVNIVRDLNLKTDFFEREIEFFALVEESLTGRKYNKSSVIKIYHKEVKLELIKTSKTFKPGLKYTAYLKVAYQDDKPVDDNGPPVTLKYGFAYNDPNWTNLITAVPVKGLIRLDIYPPGSSVSENERANVIGWRAEYRGLTYYLESVVCAHSPSGSFVQVTEQSDSDGSIFAAKPAARVGEEATFIVNATERFGDIVYEVMAKGDIVMARSIRAAPEKSGETGNTTTITIPITHMMAPKARLLVYYVRAENQEIVADALNFKVDGVFRTPVKLSSDMNQTKPGAPIHLTIATQPAAYVALLGVDQSVLLLKSGNDITQDDVMQELESYDSGKREVWTDRGGRGGWGGWFFRPTFSSGSTTAGEIFDDSGVVILTNGMLFREPKFLQYYPRMAVANIPLSMSTTMPVLDNMMPIMKKYSLTTTAASKPRTGKSAPIRLRKKFPETWIWSNISADSNGIARYADHIPDTITSWYISAFAVDKQKGLGVVEDSLKISVFRPFFVKLSLPYSIIRGESVAIPVLVFNYQSRPVSAEVTMLNEKDEFEFSYAANEIEFAGSTEVREKSKTVTIAPYDAVSVTFVVTPKTLGHIDIKIRAATDNAGDALTRKLLVKPEGQTQYFNNATLLKRDARQASSEPLSVKIPILIAPNAVPGSIRVSVSGIADILGPTMNNIDDLLRLPYGCGEQNMINFVPNIVVLNYLTRAKRLTPAIKAKALNHIETGYQRELRYLRDDGSFSAFGKSDRAGSTWLTAFVVKSFAQARPHYDAIDEAIVAKSIDWLMTRQKSDGSFAEYGEVHNRALQGGAALKVAPSKSSWDDEDNKDNNLADKDSTSGDAVGAGALTAYVLIAVLHEPKSNGKYSHNIKRAQDFIYSRLSQTANPYEAAIIAYALQLSASPHVDFALKRLTHFAKHETGELMYWPGKPEPAPVTTTASSSESGDKNNSTTAEKIRIAPVSDYLALPNSIDIETTAYALLTLASAGSDTGAQISTLRWLISKQNSNGGFSSTQDTVIGLQALGAIAQQISTSTIDMAVSIRHGARAKRTAASSSADSAAPSAPQTLRFTADNSLVLQRVELPADSEWVELNATGFGSAIVQVSYQYNIAVSAERPAFFLNPQKDRTSTENYLQLSVCTYYKDGNATNMAVMEIELPSGYNADVDALPAATRAKGVKRVDTANNDGTVFVYLDQVTRDELCITVPAHRTHRVANNKPVPVTIYDYYDRSKLSRIFYEPTPVTVNDLSLDPSAPPPPTDSHTSSSSTSETTTLSP